MKICLINNLYKPYNRGGAERVVEIVVEGLKKAGHEVVIISTQPTRVPSTPKGCSAPSVFNFYPWNIISYYNLNKLPIILRLPWHIVNIFNLQSYFRIKKILKAEQPHLVMTHNLMGVGFLTSLAIRKLKIKSIHTLHDIQLLHPSGLMFVNKEKKVNSFLAKIYQAINKKLFGSPEVVISPSKWLLEMHKQAGFFSNSKCVVLRNPMVKCHSREGGNLDNERDSRLRGNDMVFLYVGQIEKHKGVDLLLDAFSELKDKNSQLWIVGDGNNELGIRNHELGNIKMFGKKTPEEVKELMQTADCLVVPSLCYENCPTVILEAMSVDLPVIGSDIGGIPELLDNDLVFKAGNQQSLVNKMQWVIENKDKLQKINENKPKEGSVEKYVDKILSL